jgi:protoporphyrinogen oxidase
MEVIEATSKLREEGVPVSMQEISTDRTDRRFIVLGGGPAGLTAAYELTKYGFRPIVLEKADKVGGISRTESFHGYHFDMGGHRFFTKSEEVNAMWREMLGEDFLLRPRHSRIYYGGKFFDYPLKPRNVLSGLGFWESFRVGLSYARWHIFPYRREDTFKQWVTNRFGTRLFLIYFKSYTEKVWGISTSELSAEWAAQRIKGLSLPTAVLGMFFKPKAKIKTLIEEFHYPKYGPGMLWNRVRSEIERRNGRVQLNSNVSKINREGNRIVSIVVSHDGRDETVEGTDFISTIPISEFIKQLDPPPPAGVLDAASALRYRDFLTVCLIVDQPHLFDDNWLYIHDPHVKVGRIQNFKNWSPDMVPDNTKTSLGLEYFCNAGDDLWSASDADLVDLGKRELEQIGLANRSQFVDGCVFRVEKAYPVYDSHYNRHLEVIREYLDGLENARTIGRNGLHRYNNMDHSMLTGMFAVRNMVLGQNYDLWNINAEWEYHEEIQIT